MRFQPVLTAFVGGLMVAGCASGSKSAPAATPGVSDSRSATATGPYWSGSFQPTTQRTGQMAPSGQTRAYGSIQLTTAASSPQRTRARLSVDVPAPGTTLPWAVLPGRCGAGSVPIMQIELFPQIEVGSNGRGQLDAEIPLTLPTSGTFHANVYWKGQQLSDVMTCANLRLGEGK